uniref:Uncharacterized protein n=1 Tax=Utricularia reniformis TaxID=192314 RepID=A0A1Y0B0C7_9LAMI|nr:hypothetical protein AEK19_MT0594 [Utricularia reniformis]ART30850.1 hypothetical protein AEK19_MT0594 [Utricularia reniformis]
MFKSSNHGDVSYQTLDTLLHPPIVNTASVQSKSDPSLVRFGRAWKLWNHVRKRGFSWTPGIRCSDDVKFSIVWLEGFLLSLVVVG